MSIQDRSTNLMGERYKRKANQHWEMAGLARQDNDMRDAEKHTKMARMYSEGLPEEDIKAWEKQFNEQSKTT
jgi:hypothetical protein